MQRCKQMFCFLRDLKQTQSLPLGTCEYRAPASEFRLYLLFALGPPAASNKPLSPGSVVKRFPAIGITIQLGANQHRLPSKCTTGPQSHSPAVLPVQQSLSHPQPRSPEDLERRPGSSEGDYAFIRKAETRVHR